MVREEQSEEEHGEGGERGGGAVLVWMSTCRASRDGGDDSE